METFSHYKICVGKRSPNNPIINFDNKNQLKDFNDHDGS